MKTSTLFTTALFFLGILSVKGQIIATYAGNGTAGYSGDGGPATAAEIYGPKGVATDAAGNLYVADASNNRIRKVNPQGKITTYAGNGTAGYSGDGGQATAAELNAPRDVVADASGNVYFSDENNQRIRKINSSGTITTVAGNGLAGYSGDGGQATAAEIFNPTGITIDASGNLYIADQHNQRIRKINTSGIISTFAGFGFAGFSGDGGQATAAEIYNPGGITIDASGNIYIADQHNQRIRKINTSGIISTFAGNGTTGFSGDGGQATAAELHTPVAVQIDAHGNMYISDAYNYRVRKVNASGTITTVAGNGTAGYSGDGGQAIAAEINVPNGIAFDPYGNYYFADNANNRVREVYLSLQITGAVLANVSCHGGSNGSADVVTINHGTSPYSYSWTGGNTHDTATGLSAGSYTVTVTDANNITGTASVTITQPTALSVTALATDTALCPAIWDTLKSTPTGGALPYHYLWLPAPVADMGCSTCQNTSVMPYGTNYTVTVTDGNGCTAKDSVHITVHPFPFTTLTGPLSPVCAGNSDTLTASVTVAGNTYLWSNGSTANFVVVSPSVNTTYSVKVQSSYGCIDSAQYVIDTNCIDNGNGYTSAIPVTPSLTCNPASYSSVDSVVWFRFVPADSNTQIVAISVPIGIAQPHVHNLTLYDSTFNLQKSEPLADIQGAGVQGNTELRIDAMHLHIGHKYYIRAARTPAYANVLGCNPNAEHECNPGKRWSFQLCVRTVPVFIPDDSGAEAPAMSNLYYENRGQITDLNQIPRFDVKAYTNNAYPAVYLSDSLVSFAFAKMHKNQAIADTFQRVDMLPTGLYAQAPQRLFKMTADSAAGYLNYILGFIPNGVTGIYGYNRVVYKNVFPNVDMQVYSNNMGTKFYFVCNPASGNQKPGDPATIELKFRGANSMSVTADSGLSIITDMDTLKFAPGEAYEDSAGHIVPTAWHAHFEQVTNNVVRFHTGNYNTNEPLVIRVDEGHRINSIASINGLLWSTYFGGLNNQDELYDVCTDKTGDIYTTGAASSTNFPATAGAFKTSLPIGVFENATIAKFSHLDSLEWATYYGGSYWDEGHGIGVDTAGDVFVAGLTFSTNFPMPFTQPVGAYVQTTLNNNASDVTDQDAFIIKLKSDGTVPLWATYYGGANDGNVFSGEHANHLALDGLGNLYVVGGGVDPAVKSRFPIHYSTASGTPYNDSTYGTGFILEFTTNGVREWATRIGGEDSSDSYTYDGSEIYGCAVDKNNNFYITGSATDTGYTSPHTLTYTFQSTWPDEDAVVTEFNSKNNIVWSTYYGGSLNDEAHAITVDQYGNAYITGFTNSDSAWAGLNIQLKKPSASAYFQRYNGNPSGYGNGFIAEFNSSGLLQWGTYFGSTNSTDGEGFFPQAITIGNHQDLYVVGTTQDTNSTAFPAHNPTGAYSQLSYIYNNVAQVDGFVAGFSNTEYTWGTYFGSDAPSGLCIYDDTNLYMIGWQAAGSTPLQLGPSPHSYWQPGYSSNTSPFITQFDITPIITITGIDKGKPDKGSILVYPNPTGDNITVELYLKERQDLKISIDNLIGETLFEENLKNRIGIIKEQIPFNLYPDAAYILTVQTQSNVYCRKIIKLH